MARKKDEKKTERKFIRKKAAAVEEEIEKKPAVSVDAMVEENKNATVATDYQTYLRKLMKRAGGRA